MKKLWSRIPVRRRAALSALALALALFLLWGAAGWAVPSPRLALRLAEREHAYGPGQIAAQGVLSFQSEDSAPAEGRRWYVSRVENRFAAVVLERKLGLLWQCADFLPPMRPTREQPLSFTFLGHNVIHEISHGNSRAVGIEEVVAVCSADPDIVTVELTMGVMPRTFEGGPAAWLAEHGVTVVCVPAGERVWVGQPVIPQVSGTTVVRLRGRGADGGLLYDSGVP